MALLFMDGFDHYLMDDQGDKYSNVSGVNRVVSGTYARHSGNGLRMYSTSGWISKNLGVTRSTIYFGIAFYKSSTSGADNNGFLHFYDENGVNQVSIYAMGNYGFDVHSNGLIGSTPSNVYETQKWYYLEIKITISNTVGEVTMKINERQILSLTNQDTKQGTDYIEKFHLSSFYQNIYVFYDDLYIDDAQFHGDCQIKTFVPDADGNSADFTRSTGSNDYECVDEVQSNQDTDYIYSNTLNDKSIFGITTGALEEVKGIQVNNHCRLEEAGVRNIKTICRSNGTDYQGAESSEIAANYVFESEIWDTDPDDSNPWTQSKLEAAEFGLEITI